MLICPHSSSSLELTKRLLAEKGVIDMKKFFEILFDGEDKDGPGYLKLMAHLRLSTSDLLLICGLQVVIGFTLIAFVDMPWALLGYVMVIAAAHTLRTVPAIEAARAKADSAHHQ
jgi:hypothetical protein